MELRQSKSSLKQTKLLDAASQSDCSVLRTPLASIDHNSAQTSDHDASNRKCYSANPQAQSDHDASNTKCYSGKVKPDIHHLLPDRTQIQCSLVEQPANLYKLLENFQYDHIRDHVQKKYSVEERKELLEFCKACEADLHLLLEKAGDTSSEPHNWYKRCFSDDGSISKYGSMLLLATKLVSELQEAGTGSQILDVKIGGRKKQNAQAQSKKDIQARKGKAQQQSQTQTREEESVHEIFSRLATVTKDWTVEKGIVIGDVLDQKKDNICWAIVLVRMLQAIYNIGRSESLQLEFSVKELVAQIKSGDDKSLQLSNMNIAFHHIKETGVMKKPTTKHASERAGADGQRHKEAFKLCKNVDSAFVRGQVDRSPIGLSLEITQGFESLQKETIYLLPRKREITPTTRMHMVLVVGYGYTDDGQLYFIVQNSWGEGWCVRGFGRIIIKHDCDVICRE